MGVGSMRIGIIRESLIVAALVVVGSACDQAPIPEDPEQETGYAYAVHHRSCSPVDGPAQVLALTQSPVDGPYEWSGPRLTLDLYAPPFLDGPGRHEGEGATDEIGAATRCGADDDCQLADRFALRVDSVFSDGRVEAFLQVEFPGGEMVAGFFTARRIDFEPLCG